MLLYKINDNGEFSEIYKIQFKASEIFVVDDNDKNAIYIWVGLNASEKKKEFAADFARQIESEKGESMRILIMRQNREYGSFLAMMNDLQRGLIPGKTSERRPEMKLEKPVKIPEVEPQLKSIGIPTHDKEYQILAWLEQVKLHRKAPIKVGEETKAPIVDFATQIKEAAYYISLKNFTYDELCWFLAEKIQRVNLGMPSLEDIKSKAEEVFQSSITYDELCWLNAEVDILLEKSYLQKGKVKFR
jgi:hypothetical protein